MTAVSGRKPRSAATASQKDQSFPGMIELEAPQDELTDDNGGGSFEVYDTLCEKEEQDSLVRESKYNLWAGLTILYRPISSPLSRYILM